MTPSLAPDCDNCAALCCIALAFDAGDSFAFDKPAGLPCINLDRHACMIHATLPQKGFSGCVAFDCLGAGQRVTQDLFAGASWRDTPKLAAPMFAAFSGMCAIHRRIELLMASAGLPLSDSDEAIRAAHLAKLSDVIAPDLAAAFPASRAEAAIDAFIASLRRYVSAG